MEAVWKCESTGPMKIANSEKVSCWLGSKPKSFTYGSWPRGNKSEESVVVKSTLSGCGGRLASGCGGRLAVCQDTLKIAEGSYLGRLALRLRR